MDFNDLRFAYRRLDSQVERFNRRVPLLLRLVLVVALGIALSRLIYYGTLVYQGIMMSERPCSISEVIQAPANNKRFVRLMAEVKAVAKIINRDPEYGIVEVSAEGNSFWVKESGEGMNGFSLIPFLVAEHKWMAAVNPYETVQPGDTVIDCGAHVGTFAAFALARGARQVIAIEPEPINLECLRRNFKRELAEKRLILVPKAVWNEITTIRFTISDSNSGMGSSVIRTGVHEIEVPATTIDAIVSEQGLGRIDYIKMDIEGAERYALAGASETLKRFQPKLMLESYHLPDDPIVLPQLLHKAHPGYKEICGPCVRETRNRGWYPYVLYFR
jgi:FkbM family methyltransferase